MQVCRKKIIAGISSSSNLRRHYKTVHHTQLYEYDRVKCEHNENSKKIQLQEPNVIHKIQFYTPIIRAGGKNV